MAARQPISIRPEVDTKNNKNNKNKNGAHQYTRAVILSIFTEIHSTHPISAYRMAWNFCGF